jgi:hypothetical protein
MKKQFSYILLLLYIVLLSACGGGGTSASSGNTIKAIIKASALTAALNIGGIQMAIALPQSVTPSKKPDGSWDEAAVVEFISSASPAYQLQNVKYYSASSSLEFSVINLAGFSTEDQIIIHLVLAAGPVPTKSEFSIISSALFDKVTGATVGIIPELDINIH